MQGAKYLYRILFSFLLKLNLGMALPPFGLRSNRKAAQKVYWILFELSYAGRWMRNGPGKQKGVLIQVRKNRNKIYFSNNRLIKSWNLIKKGDIPLEIFQGHWVCFWICLRICFRDLTLPVAFQFRLVLILTIKLGKTLIVYRMKYH